jgi:hypothetical protein
VAFLLDPPLTTTADPAAWRRRLDAYLAYIRSVQDRLPAAAMAFATASWHWDTDDHRCPHDSRLDRLTMTEAPASSGPPVCIQVRLLGAYHDGYLVLTYIDVVSYQLAGNAPLVEGRHAGHGDWLVDEIRLSERGLMVHEVVFANRSRWDIECRDFTWTWEPIN